MSQPSISVKTPNALTWGGNVIHVRIGREVFDANVALYGQDVHFGRMEDWASPALRARLEGDDSLAINVQSTIRNVLRH